MYAFITGASSGIGKEMAFMLAKKGYDLILVARREERLKKMKKYLEYHYPIRVEIAVCDLSSRNACGKLCKTYSSYNIEIVINAAGFGKIGYITETSLKEQVSMIDTNISALHILSHYFAKHMTQGYILNIASIAGFQPGPYLSTYGATKAYVASFSLALGYELKKQGKNISVTTVCPGPVDTEFNHVAGTDFSLPSISAKECAKEALQGMFHKKSLVLPGFTNKLSYVATKFAPLCVKLPLTYQIQRAKKK